MRGAGIAFAAVLLAVASVASVVSPVAGQGTGGAGAINVVSADDEGCSGDRFSDADMRVSVRVDGAEVLETQKAQDEQEPLFAELASGIDAAGGVTVTIEAWEAEPGGSFGFGTVWESCDTDPGPGRSYTFTWHGEERVVTTRGDEGDAAEVVVVFGSGAPAPPVLTIQPGPSSADVAWMAWPGADGHRLTWGDAGDLIVALGPDDTSHRLGNLCENTEYTVRLVRDQSPWHVGSEDTGFRTLNAAPVPPRVLSADVLPNGTGWRVAAELPTHRDLERVEIHHDLADPSFEAGSATLVQTNTSVVWGYDETFTVASAPTTGYVRLRAFDQGGLSAVSPPFALGGPHAASQPPPACNGGLYQATSGPGEGTLVDADDDHELPEVRELPPPTANPGGVVTFPVTVPPHREGEAVRSGTPPIDPWDNPIIVGVAAGAVALFLGVVIGMSARRR